MSVLEKLISERAELMQLRENRRNALATHQAALESYDVDIADLDKAISALSEGEGGLLANPPSPSQEPNAQATGTYASSEDWTKGAEGEVAVGVKSYDEAQAQLEIPEGFIPWSGGEMPVHENDVVEVMFDPATGLDRTVQPAYDCNWTGEVEEGEHDWAPIIAYRPTGGRVLGSETEEASEPSGSPTSQPQSEEHTRSELAETSEVTSELDSPVIQQTVIEQSENPPGGGGGGIEASDGGERIEDVRHVEEVTEQELFHPDAKTWSKALAEDHKPKPGFIETTVSKLFGVKEPA